MLALLAGSPVVLDLNEKVSALHSIETTSGAMHTGKKDIGHGNASPDKEAACEASAPSKLTLAAEVLTKVLQSGCML